MEEVPLCRDVAASACSSSLVLAQIKELVSRIQGLLDLIVDVPVPKVTGEIPVFVGVWEEIVEAIQLVRQEQVFQSVREQGTETRCGADCGSTFYTTGARAKSYAGADCGIPCASDLGGARAKSYAGADCGIPCASDLGGARAKSHAGADCGIHRASDLGGARAKSHAGADCGIHRASDLGGARAKSYAGADYGFSYASDHGGSFAFYTTGAPAKSYAGANCGIPCASDFGAARAESYAGADCGFTCASDQGGSRGSFAFYTTGARAVSHAGAGCGFPCASDHGGNCGGFAFYTTGTRAESHAGARAVPNRGADRWFGAADKEGHRGYDSACASGARAESNRGADRRFAAQDHGGHRGNDSVCASRARTSRGADRGPQIMKGVVKMTHRALHERVHERVVGQIGDVPVPQITEDIVDGKHHVPQECVPQLRKKRVFLDWPRRPASQPNTGKVKCTGKVFSVKMRHHRVDEACAVDTVGLNIKGLNKYNMPQSGDVMVRASDPRSRLWTLVDKSK